LLGGNIAGGSPNITLSQAGNITATGNLSVTGTTRLNSFVFGNINNSRLYIADTISLSGNKEIEFYDVNVKIARESTSSTQLNFDILSTTQASVREGSFVVGDDKISLATDGSIAAAGRLAIGSSDNGTTFTDSYAITAYNSSASTPTVWARNSTAGGPVFIAVDAAGVFNATIFEDGSINAAGNLSVTGTTRLNNFVFGNATNNKLYIADTIGLSGNKEIEFSDDNVKIARESTSVTQLNFDILSTTQASVRNGRVVIGDEKISLTTGGAITTAGTITAGGMIAANGGLEAYIPTNNLLSYSQRWFDDKYTTRGLVGAMGIGGSFWVKQALTVGLDQNDAQVTLSSDGSITAAGSATFAGALEAESIDGGTY